MLKGFKNLKLGSVGVGIMFGLAGALGAMGLRRNKTVELHQSPDAALENLMAACTVESGILVTLEDGRELAQEVNKRLHEGNLDPVTLKAVGNLLAAVLRTLEPDAVVEIHEPQHKTD